MATCKYEVGYPQELTVHRQKMSAHPHNLRVAMSVRRGRQQFLF
jgi:hypothetical protein